MEIGKNTDQDIHREPIRYPITGKCNWCNKRSATITDGTYVYCSNNCKKEFQENAIKAAEDTHNNNMGHYNEN